MGVFVFALAVEEAQGTPDLELLQRLLSVPGTPAQVVEVTLGRLPDGWPQGIPIPGEAELIGAVVLSDGSITVGGRLEPVNYMPSSPLCPWEERGIAHGFVAIARRLGW